MDGSLGETAGDAILRRLISSYKEKDLFDNLRESVIFNDEDEGLIFNPAEISVKHFLGAPGNPTNDQVTCLGDAETLSLSSAQPPGADPDLQQQTSTDSTDSTAAAMFKKKTYILHELYATELNYVFHLQLFVKTFVKPLKTFYRKEQASKTITENIITNIFGNIEQILAHHEVWLDKLEKIAPAHHINYDTSTWNNDTVVSKTLDDLIRWIGVYLVYCNNYQKSQLVLTNCYKSKKFKRIIDEINAITEKYKQSLSSFMVLPIQRITRYNLLFSRLVADTPADHPDYSALAAKTELLKNSTAYINEMKNCIETSEKVASMDKKVHRLLAQHSTSNLLAHAASVTPNSNNRLKHSASDIDIHAQKTSQPAAQAPVPLRKQSLLPKVFEEDGDSQIDTNRKRSSTVATASTTAITATRSLGMDSEHAASSKESSIDAESCLAPIIKAQREDPDAHLSKRKPPLPRDALAQNDEFSSDVADDKQPQCSVSDQFRLLTEGYLKISTHDDYSVYRHVHIALFVGFMIISKKRSPTVTIFRRGSATELTKVLFTSHKVSFVQLKNASEVILEHIEGLETYKVLITDQDAGDQWIKSFQKALGNEQLILPTLSNSLSKLNLHHPPPPPSFQH